MQTLFGAAFAIRSQRWNTSSAGIWQPPWRPVRPTTDSAVVHERSPSDRSAHQAPDPPCLIGFTAALAVVVAEVTLALSVTPLTMTRRALLEEALRRFRANHLDLPVVDVRFSGDPADCHGHDGEFLRDSEPWRVVVCSHLEFVITHELAHAWVAANLDAADRDRYIAARGLTNWNDHGVPWTERGTEDAAFAIQQNLMPTKRPASSPVWAERIESYELLTDMPSPLRQR